MEGISHHCLPGKAEPHLPNVVHPALAWLYLLTAAASSSQLSLMALTWIKRSWLVQSIRHLEPSITHHTYMHHPLHHPSHPHPNMLCRGPCLPWLHSWLTGTALLDGRDNGQAKQEQSYAAFLHVSQFPSQPFFASSPGFRWL